MAKRKRAKFFKLIPNRKTSFGSARYMIADTCLSPWELRQIEDIVDKWYGNRVITFREHSILKRMIQEELHAMLGHY